MSDNRRILNDKNSRTEFLGSSWVTLFDFSSLSYFLGFIIRAAIICIQFFIVIVRPLTAKSGSNYYDWSIAFASSLFSFQLILYLGLLSENFGGPMNNSLEELLAMSRKRFFDSFQSTIIAKIDDDFEKAGYWKLIEAQYVANPMYEDYIGLTLFILGMLVSLCCSGANSGLNAWAKNLRIGSSIAFMMPLMISSVNCIYAVFKGGIYTTGAMFGLCVSILLLVYYIFFGFEMMGSNKKSAYYKSSYVFMNFDWPTWRAKSHIKNYEFLVHWVLISIMVATANIPKVTLPFATFLFAANFLCIGITPTKQYVAAKHSLIHKIKILKLVDSFFKTLLFCILSFYVF
jgi:hypothetical protein